MSSEQVEKIGRLSTRQFDLVMIILKAGHLGSELTQHLLNVGPGMSYKNSIQESLLKKL